MENSRPPITIWFILSVLLRALILFTAANLILAAANPTGLGKLSAYNYLFPGRQRLPFGEDSARSYNLSLYNLDAMFASHEVAERSPAGEELRVFLIGDSSVWGTVLDNSQTLSGQLNRLSDQLCGKPVKFYNLGYPTISLTKDLVVLNEALEYQPDAVIWLTTLEAFPLEKQTSTPLVANNADEVKGLLFKTSLDAKITSQSAEEDFWSRTIPGRRRALADLARLQLFGVMWAATGIDQDPAAGYEAAALDYEADASFHGLQPGDDLSSALAWEALNAGQQMAGSVPILLVNEPILVSRGRNSDLRYNLYYPRWAYNAFREELAERVGSLGLAYLDAWDLVPPEQFTNSAIHLTPAGEGLLAQRILEVLPKTVCLP